MSYMKKLKGIVVDGMFFTFDEYLVYLHEYADSDDQETYKYNTLQSLPCFNPELHEDYTDIYYDKWHEEIPDEYRG